MAKYYTLEESAQRCGLSNEEFRKKLATEWKGKLRPMMDGTTQRFPAAAIDELARVLGQGSDTALRLADDSGSGFVAVDDDDALSAAGPASGSRSGKPDSDVKLEKGGKPKSGVQANIRTEEMDVPGGSPKPTSTRKFQSPLEVSGEAGGKQPRHDASSSEFELSLTPDSSDEFDLKLTDDSDEVDVGSMPSKAGGALKGNSGINLKSPADSGISLEKSSSEFELAGESGVSKPKSGPKSGPKTGPRSGPKSGPKTPSKSAPVPTNESDSEFELTLDDAAAAGDGTSAFEEQKDIFETDFELPALDDESGSEAVALNESDTDLESSDFDLALGEGDADSEDVESESQVTAIPESGRRRRAKAVADEEELDEFDDELADAEPARPAASAKSWGVLPALVLIPTVIVMILVGMMSFELLRGMWGYSSPSKPSGLLVRFFADKFVDLPKD